MDIRSLSGTELFRGIREEDLGALVDCLNTHEKRYAKGSTIWRAGERVSEVGLVEQGSVNVLVNFYGGDSHIFSHIEAGQIFGETYAAIPEKELQVDIVASEDSVIAFFDMTKLLCSCASNCDCHGQIIRNLVRISAAKNLGLNARMMHTAARSIRERLLSYLSYEAREKGSNHFFIPFSRQELADYLGVDRSALSSELGRMQRDGLIRFHKNEFTLEREV